jgi:nitroreductase
MASAVLFIKPIPPPRNTLAEQSFALPPGHVGALTAWSRWHAALVSEPDPDAFADLVRARRSVRDFRSDPIPAELLDRVVGDATWAPSWSNTQPYLLAVATGAARERLQQQLTTHYDAGMKARHGGLLDKAKLLLTRTGLPAGDFDTSLTYPDELQPYRRKTGFGLYGVLGIERSDTTARSDQMRRNFEFFGAPAAIFLFVHEGLAEFAVLDAGTFLQTLLLSAHANGLGTCAQGALATWPAPVRREFDVPARYKLICGVAIGYASDHPINAYNPGRRAAPRAGTARR